MNLLRALLPFLFVVFTLQHHCSWKDSIKPTISVQGQALSSHSPDQVLVSFSIITLDMSANKSLADNNQILQSSIKSLNELGYKEEHISIKFENKLILQIVQFLFILFSSVFFFYEVK